MRITKTKLAVVGVAAVGLIGGGTALAYWSTTGAGEGQARAGYSTPVLIEQVGTIAGLAPGAAPQHLQFKITNAAGNPSQMVSSVSATIAGVEKTSTVVGTCDASDFTIAGPAAVGHEFTPGEVQSYDPSDLTIAFNNKPTNQDACKGAIVYLAFAAS